MFDHPCSLQGVYSSIFNVNFPCKMQENQYLRVHCTLAKNSTASLKNSTDMSAPSARFSKYAQRACKTL